jgi:hypothetical protein
MYKIRKQQNTGRGQNESRPRTAYSVFGLTGIGEATLLVMARTSRAMTGRRRRSLFQSALEML